MFGSWGPWLGRGSARGGEEEVNKPPAVAHREEDGQQQLLQRTKAFRGYIYEFASSASKKLSESVVETAQTLKRSVEEGTIHGMIDKTILGEFQKEQEKFIQEKKANMSGAAVPPWVGQNEEEAVQQQILALSSDQRNFLRDPPAGVQFHFRFEQMSPVAMVMLEEDELLRRMRFHLVPKKLREDTFWRNYFYRVSLIKQSAQLGALAAQQAAERRREERRREERSEERSEERRSEETAQRRDVVVCSSKPKSSEEEAESSPSGSEFASDAFDSFKVNEDDLRKDMEQLVLDRTQPEETPDWERELQEELQEYDVLADNENRDHDWDREIEEMLMEDS